MTKTLKGMRAARWKKKKKILKIIHLYVWCN